MKYAVLYGGTDGERAISIKSGAYVVDTLTKMGLELDEWTLPDQIDEFIEHRREYSLAFPMFHGAYGEDGMVFGLLKGLDIPHTHSEGVIHALAFDKQKTNVLVGSLGVPTARSMIVGRDESIDVQKVRDYFDGTELFLKPNTGGSSIGAFKVDSYDQLEGLIEESQGAAPGETLVETYLSGAEYSVGIIGNGSNLETTPIMKVELSDAEFFDFDVKYNDDGGLETFPDDIDPRLSSSLIQYSKDIYSYLGCETLARADFILDDKGVPHFLEINTVPGFTQVSIIPRGWRSLGKTDEELLQKVIDLSAV